MQELRQLPAGDLCIRKGKGDSFYTYHTNQHDTRGVLRDRKLTRSLARKCFLKKKVHSSTLWCQGLQRLIQDMEIQERCEARSLHPITRSRLPDVFEEKDYRLSPMQREWLYGNYEQYRRAGYVQHSNLICTYEEDLRSGAVLEEILLRYELYS